ncbi:hypothetical protein [Streptomyces cirratus]|uniref:hypothetical protein n=1 Tax=Streptomyces cirratus TaxID=68187 RepID=UPI00362240A2
MRTERDELAVAERVWQRMAEQLAAERGDRAGRSAGRRPSGAAGPAPWARRG